MPRRRFDALLPWPAPAMLAWAVGWVAALVVRQAGLSEAFALAGGTVSAVALACWNEGALRRLIAAAGYPVAVLVSGGVGQEVHPLVWLLALAPLLLLYPVRAWRDAPFFPTPSRALQGLGELVRPAPRRVLDAGCGLGHGLSALRRVWPGAALHGIEWSLPMAWLAKRRMPRADIRRGDMWAGSWAGFDLVYIFQRPETMPRAWQKAGAEMADGAWFASLEFPVPGVAPVAVVDAGVGRPVHVYRVRNAATSARGSRSTGAPAGR